MAIGIEESAYSTLSSGSGKPDISVIVPVYNVEPYLRRCIESLIEQTLQKIEILLVDDGSTDRSGQICEEYAGIDQRIRVIHQENGGLSAARNAGINRAKADYLMFVDSDDWVEQDFCKIPLEAAKKYQADLVMFQYKRCFGGRERKGRFDDTREGIVSEADAIRLVLTGVGMMAWNKLYHRRLFEGVRYPAGQLFEDVATTPLLVHAARRIVCLPDVLYIKVFRRGSITASSSYGCVKDLYASTTRTSRHLKEWGYSEDSDFLFQTRMLHCIALSSPSSEAFLEGVRYFRGLHHYPSRFSPRRKCMYYLLVLSPRLYRSVYHLISRFPR